MSRSRKGKKGPGYEYWSKRPMAGSPPGRISKTITHKKERAIQRKSTRAAVDAADKEEEEL